MSVRFAIDRITVHGYRPSQRARFIATLRASLGELGATTDWSATQSRALERIDAGSLPPGATPEAAARMVAARIGSTFAASSARADGGAAR